MPLHPSTGFRWLNRWLSLIGSGKEGKKPNDYLVGVAGFEPATPASRTQCSTGLSHTPTKEAAYSRACRPLQEAGTRIYAACEIGPDHLDSARWRGRPGRGGALPRGRRPGRVPDRDGVWA